jgi:hypothetical protein
VEAGQEEGKGGGAKKEKKKLCDDPLYKEALAQKMFGNAASDYNILKVKKKKNGKGASVFDLCLMLPPPECCYRLQHPQGTKRGRKTKRKMARGLVCLHTCVRIRALRFDTLS